MCFTIRKKSSQRVWFQCTVWIVAARTQQLSNSCLPSFHNGELHKAAQPYNRADSTMREALVHTVLTAAYLSRPAGKARKGSGQGATVGKVTVKVTNGRLKGQNNNCLAVAPLVMHLKIQNADPQCLAHAPPCVSKTSAGTIPKEPQPCQHSSHPAPLLPALARSSSHRAASW